ncbi:MAG TPA: RtcB family protein [Thermoanaerobaculia bacterium]|nr:RtcB family protein [Thermoanaerobaculia bacterium]
MVNRSDLQKIDDQTWEIPQSYRPDMRVPARLYTSERMLDSILADRSLEQLVNVATLPGIQRHALAMPDVHEGYGFPIGGVAAFDLEDGVISPGGIGYDINCGVRLLTSRVVLDDVRDRVPKLAHSMAREIPSGVGRGGALRLKGADLDAVLTGGARQAIAMGYGEEADLRGIESNGALSEADAALVSDRAKQRGSDQLGTMGAGNHFVEIDVVEAIFDEQDAAGLGLFRNQLAVLIHTGSRGLGHQIATDFLKRMTKAMPRYGLSIPDRELACAPFGSPEGTEYFAAMAAGANFAWANRQVITASARRAWRFELGDEGALAVLYDVAHNVAKIEEHQIGSVRRNVVVHRKGATRAFPGQPVLIPGSMATGSWVLIGRDEAMRETFGSSCHGAGRTMSRSRAKKEIDGGELKRRMQEMGISVEGGSLAGLVEEAPEAYKDVDAVIDVVHRAGIAKKVARLRPVAVIKG